MTYIYYKKYNNVIETKYEKASYDLKVVKNMKSRSMIFTLYGDYIQHYGDDIWIGSLIKCMEKFGFTPQSVRAAISRMSKQGWLEAKKEGNKSYYTMTPRGFRRLKEAAKRIYKMQAEPWDGKWRILIYNIPEAERHIRDELRQELVWSGFGLLSNSCWITPLDLQEQVEELFARYKIDTYADFFTAQYKGVQSNVELVQKCWNLAEINARYHEFVEDYQDQLEKFQKESLVGQVDDGACFVERAQLVHEYRKFLFIDPGLPEELLPRDWAGKKASQLFKEYYKVLTVPANRFFESVYEGLEMKSSMVGESVK